MEPAMRWVRNVAAPAAAGLVFVMVASHSVAQDRDEKPSVRTLPPVVVRTMPQSGDTKVDAAKVKEILVTFSKEMTDKSWSWTQISDDTYPEITGEIHYQKNKRTCVAPVKLKPGRTYVIWLNSAKFGNFKDADERSAVPYLLVFETKPAKG
jgi:hypothetical protein